MTRRVPLDYALGLTISAFLGVLIIPSRGQYRADSMVFVFGALGLAIFQLWSLVTDRKREVDERAMARGAVVVLAGFLVSALVDAKLLVHVPRPWLVLNALTVVELGLVLSYLRDRPGEEAGRWARLRFGLLAGCVAVSAIAVVRLSPVPEIDVWTVQSTGAKALLEGKNPFVEVSVKDTAPGVFDNPTPYVYPPFQLLATLPFYLLGDVRFAMATGLLVFGFAVRAIASGTSAASGDAGADTPPILRDAPALVVWLSPKVLFLLENAWIDPVQIALIAGSTWLALRNRMWAATVGFGFVLAAKQTMFWVAPLAFFAFPAFRIRHAIAAAAIAASFYIPFALWNWPAFYHANVGFVGGLPARPDALGFVNWARRALGVTIPHAIAFPLAAAVVGWAALRRRARPELFGGLLFVTYFVFFTINKWTFANYYFSLLAFAALAAAQRGRNITVA